MIGLDLFLIPDPENWSATLGTVRLLEEAGFHGLWVPDSPPTHWRDPYVTLALCARETERLTLGTGVTNPVTRHVSVTAGAIAHIEHLAPGRAILGIGAGDAAVRAIGMKPASMRELATYIAGVRQWLGDHGVRVPVYQSASGPRALETAGQIADGVLISVGTHPALIEKARQQVWRSAREAGRDPDTIALTFVLHGAVLDDGDAARRAATPMAARKALDLEWHADFIGSELEHLREDARRLAQDYDFRQHMNPNAPHNRLVTDGLIDAMVCAGTPAACLERMRALERCGVTSVAFFPSGSRRYESIETLARAVAPQVGERGGGQGR
jgi:5,10-methylenetetrahydromethanopterin reductase